MKMSPEMRKTRLKYVADIVGDTLPAGTDATMEIDYVDIGNVDPVTSTYTADTMSFGDAPSRARQRVCEGDVIFSTVRPYLKAIARISAPTERLVVSTGFAVLRAKPTLDPEFLAWAVQGKAFIDRVAAHSNGVSYPAITARALEAIEFRVPTSEADQRAIARWLDVEVAHIDEMVASLERLLELEELRDRALIGALFGAVADADQRRLKYVAPDITVGIVVTPSAYYAPEGVPALRSLNVKPMRIDRGNLAFIDPDSHQKLLKSALYEGDVVVVRTGKPGTSAVVTAEFHDSNCVDLIIVRKSSKVDSRYLAFFLNSTLAHRQYEEGAEGALQQHFNIETARNLRVPVPSLSRQKTLAAEIQRHMDRGTELKLSTLRSIDLLRERRTAIITAAVGGQVNVNGAKFSREAA